MGTGDKTAFKNFLNFKIRIFEFIIQQLQKIII